MNMGQLQEIAATLRGGLTTSGVLLAVCVLLVLGYAAARMRGVAGTVPRSEVAATSACLAFTLLTLQLCHLDWNLLSVVGSKAPVGRGEMPLPQRLLDVVAGVRQLPTFDVSFVYALVALGLGMWAAAVTEARLGEPGLPRLRVITIVMGLGSLALLGLSVWSQMSIWSVVAALVKGTL